MLKDILRIWPLFLGMLTIGLVSASQSSLLGIRTSNEGFSETWLGAVITAYFVGFLLGSIVCPKLIRRVGHVRTFAALAALASMTILIHPIIIDPLLWTLMRFGSGFAIAGIVVVSEAWLNRACSDENRGQMLSIYMVIYTIGLIGGQLLLNLGNPNNHELFTLISILMSFAAIPMLLSSTPIPSIEVFESMKIQQLWKWAPYGVLGAFLMNMTLGIMFGMGAVYATRLGLSVMQVSFFMSALLLGNAVLQWPLGKLSDVWDRRKVITSIAVIGSVMAMIAANTEPDTWQGLVAAALVGGFTLPLYALFIALTNDHMKSEKILPASGTLVLIAGCGTVVGPLLATWSMDHYGIHSYFWIIAAVMFVIAIYGAYRCLFIPYVPKENKHEFSIYAPSTLGANLRVNDSTQADD